ncbi:hypothetical protein [Metapseudomonas otitidis]|uniref:hypothetical protein n=1 Tax=Metapseudomonas otitidis TaxID=319939 RepID=UPI002810A26B|nr:hypothetical protein [Pseudomonas otitidis]WMR34741.1 hypothetical protein QT513_08385 [Pseudomonas otitidis]
MAMTSQQRSAKAAEKRRQRGEEELRHRVRPGIKAKLADLMAWHGIEEISEAVQLMTLNLHALGPEGSAPAFAVPRHEITVSENVAYKLRTTGAAEADRIDQEDI